MGFKLGKRKIQRLKYSFFVSIPKIWLENRGLQKGSTVELEVDDRGDLVVRPAAIS